MAGCVGNAGLEADTGRQCSTANSRDKNHETPSRVKPRDAFTCKRLTAFTSQRSTANNRDKNHETPSQVKPRDAFACKRLTAFTSQRSTANNREKPRRGRLGCCASGGGN